MGSSGCICLAVLCWRLDWQVTSMVQISDSLSQIFSAVEHLTLEHKEHSKSPEDHNKVNRTKWLKLLRPFRNVKTIRIEGGLVEGLFRCLELDDGEFPLELLPELQELTPESNYRRQDRRVRNHPLSIFFQTFHPAYRVCKARLGRPACI
jgi:hypothetical protein